MSLFLDILRSSKFENLNLLTDLLFQCILIEPGTLKESLLLLDNLNYRVNKVSLRHLLNNLIEIHAPLNHGSEVAWALWAAIYHDISINSKVVDRLKGFDDSIVVLLSLHAIQKGLMKEEAKTFWSHLMTRESLVDGHWLLAYEASVKNWLPSIDNHIDSDEYFSILKHNRVSFYDEGVGYFNQIHNVVGYDYESNDDDLPF